MPCSSWSRPRNGRKKQRKGGAAGCRRMTGTAGTASAAGPTIRPGMTGAAGRAPSAAAARVLAVTWGTAGTQDIPPAATPSRTPIMTPMRPAPAGTRSARWTTAPTRTTASPFPPAGGAAKAAHSAPAAGRTASGAPPGAISGTAARPAARTGTPSAARRTLRAAAASGCGRCRGRTPGVTPSGGRAGKSGS